MMIISSGGVANSTTINSGGKMYISSGGVANSTVVSGYSYFGASASLVIHDGGVANSTTVDYFGSMHIHDGGVANSTTVSLFGSMFISSGGVAENTFVSSGGNMYLSGGIARNTQIFSGAVISWADGSAEGVQVNSNASLLVSNMVISDLLLKERGVAYLSNCTLAGAEVEKLAILQFCSGTVASNVFVSSGGHCYIGKDAVVSGSFTIESGSTVIAFTGSELNFTVDALTAGNTQALVNNLAAIRGNIDYSLTVSTDQAAGIYRLADGVTAFNKKVQLACGENLWDAVILDQTYSNDNMSFELFVQDNSLYLEITDLTTAQASDMSAFDSGSGDITAYNNSYDGLENTAATDSIANDSSNDPFKNGFIA